MGIALLVSFIMWLLMIATSTSIGETVILTISFLVLVAAGIAFGGFDED